MRRLAILPRSIDVFVHEGRARREPLETENPHWRLFDVAFWPSYRAFSNHTLIAAQQ